MKFSCSVILSDNGREVREKLVLKSGPSEMLWHIGLKIVGRLLFSQYKPLIEHGVGWHYKPDLVALDEHGGIALWVDCGNIAVKKISRVSVKVGDDGKFFILRRNRREAEQLRSSMPGKVKRPERVHILYFDDGFADGFADILDGSNIITARLEKSALSMTVDNRHGRTEFKTMVESA